MRRGPLLVLLALVLASAATAGCFGENRSPVDVTPYLSTHRAEPGRTVHVPLFLNSTYTFKQDLGLGVGDLPEGWTYRLPVQEVTLPGHKGRHVVIEITPAAEAPPGETEVDVFVGDTRATLLLNLTAPAPETRHGSVVNLTWTLLDRNGTIVAWHEPLLSQGLKYDADAAPRDAPLRVYLGGPDDATTPPGLLRLPAEMETRLLQAKAGEAVVMDGALPPDPTVSRSAPEGWLILRLADPREPDAA